MPSLRPGYEYDIFISYRQKDNKYDGWVTEFVSNLKKELEATFKEDISIYFDENPHDGLLETHNVDKSLENKLRCLVFIPILSQTYCDPKSFAWQHEFCAFNKLAKEDPLGRDIKLNIGNVSSRILPVKIHDLDAKDKSTYESEIGGVLRAIEFIYKEPGVNRPLHPADDRNDNKNKTGYRNQVNKVANAIKELITSISAPDGETKLPKTYYEETVPKVLRKQLTVGAAGLIIVGILSFSIFYFTDINKQFMRGKSIAVLPFKNMNNDPEQEYFCDGITEQVISSLARLNDIKVIARTSVMKYKNSTMSIAQIGKELNVTHILEGSVRKSGDQLRVSAKLIAVKSESHLWTEDFTNKSTADIFQIQDDVSTRIASTLKSQLQPQEKERLRSERPTNPEAYEHLLKGEYIHANYYIIKLFEEDFTKAENEFLQAIRLDSNYATAYAALANLYDTRANLTTSPDDIPQYRKLNAKFADMAYKLNPTLPYSLVAKFESWAHPPFANRDSAFKYIKTAYESSPNNSMITSELGMFYCYGLGICDLGLPFLKKGAELSPGSSYRHMGLSFMYYSLHDLARAEQSVNKALSIEPNSVGALIILVLLNSDQKKFEAAGQALARLRNVNPSENFDHLEARILAEKGDVAALEKSRNLTIYLILKKKEETLAIMEKSDDVTNWNNDRFYHLEFDDPHFDFLRGNPRFEKIMAKANEIRAERIKKYRLKAPPH